MPRFKTVHKGLKLLPLDFDKQLLPGSFEHALCYLVDHELDLGEFHARYRNDVDGAPAYDPAVLLKIGLLAYSRGIVSSRKMEAACREHVLFMAVSGDSQPHFTTLAAFVSTLGDLAARLFAQVLAVCDRQGLIGREMFAIDGVKLPSNASKARSGSRADFLRQAEKMEKAAQAMIAQQCQSDRRPEDDEQTRSALGQEPQAAHLQAVYAGRLPLRPGAENLRVPDRQVTVRQRQPLPDQGAAGDQVPGRHARLPGLPAARKMPANSTENRDAPGGVLPAQDSAGGRCAGADAPTDRRPQGREMIGRHFATVEPVFGNLRHNKRLDRFTLRGRARVDGQWKLYCLTHNIEKLATHGAWR